MKLPNILLLITLALANTLLGQGSRMGDLTSDTEVLTSDAPHIKDGFPVFLIPVPPPYTEVQLRASITNFEPGFLLKLSGVPIHNFIPLIDEDLVGGKRQYRALGSDLLALWNSGLGRWEISIGGGTIYYTGPQPWNEATALDSNSGVCTWLGLANYSASYEPFVFHTCTTSKSAEDLVTPGTWGTGSGDPDPWVFFSKQDTDPADFADHFRLQKWDWNTSLSSQISTVGGVWSLGHQVIYQPSRGVLGASEWMQQNLDRLTWVYQLQQANGAVQLQPNGNPVWHVTHPAEWRKNRIELPIP